MLVDIKVLSIFTAAELAIKAEGFVPLEFECDPVGHNICSQGKGRIIMRTAENTPLADVNLTWASNVSGEWTVQCFVAGSAAEGTSRGVAQLAEHVVRSAIQRAKHGTPTAERADFIRAGIRDEFEAGRNAPIPTKPGDDLPGAVLRRR